MRLTAFFLVAVVTTILSNAGDTGQPASVAEARKSLADPKLDVRLCAVLTLVKQRDEPAVGVLIDLLADLPHDGRVQAESALRDLAGEWSPTPALQGDDELSRRFAARPGPAGGVPWTEPLCWRNFENARQAIAR